MGVSHVDFSRHRPTTTTSILFRNHNFFTKIRWEMGIKGTILVKQYVIRLIT